MTHSENKTSTTPFLVIGILTGAGLSQLIHYFPDNLIFTIFPYRNAHNHFQIPFFYYCWIGFFSLMFFLAYPSKSSLTKLIIGTMIASLLASLPFSWGNNHSTAQFILFVFSSFALNAFNISFQVQGWGGSYPPFFYAIWDSGIKSLISFFISLLAWIILYLTALLFKAIHLNLIDVLINKPSVAIFLTSLFISIGFWIPNQVTGIVNSIRAFFLHICRYLYIPLAVVGILFMVSLVVTEQFHFDSRSENIFLFIPFLSVLFVNGIYQDGLSDHAYTRILHWIASLFLLITPLFTVLGIYIIFYFDNDNIHQHGITTHNFPILFNSLLLLIYNLSYAAISISKRKPWLKNIEKCNVILAIVLIASALITAYY